MKVQVYRIGSQCLRARPRLGKAPKTRLKRPWAPYKHRELILVCISPVPISYWQHAQAKWKFQAQADRGKPFIALVENMKDRGRSFLMRSGAYEYGDAFPTSGPYDPDWVKVGFYDSPRAPTILMHSLRRGAVVIYYDKPSSPVLETLKQWAGLFHEDYGGIVVVSYPGLGDEIVLTAWNKRLRLSLFNPNAAAAFINAFRGHGPESTA